MLPKLARFLAWGIPGFVLAVPLNYALVEWGHLPRPVAYGLVLVVQVTVNFFACRYFVFDVHPEAGGWRGFALFFHGILGFRLADWGLYSLLTALVTERYLVVQFMNVLLFSVLKYYFAKSVFERKPLQRTKVESQQR